MKSTYLLQLQYEKPREGNLGDLSCGHNISLKQKSPHGESYNFVFYSPTFSGVFINPHTFLTSPFIDLVSMQANTIKSMKDEVRNL